MRHWPIVIVGHCSGGVAQQWMLPPDNTVRIAAECLEAGGNTAGSRIYLAACNGSPSEFWEPSGVVMIPGVELINPASGLCLDDPGAATAGTRVVISTCTRSDAEIWYPPPTHPGPVPPPPGIAYPLSAGPAGTAAGG